MKHFVLTYHYVEDYMARRDAFRAEHLARISSALEQGRILAAGVLPQGPRALIVFYADSADEVKAFAEGDPYYKAGLIASFEIDDWALAAGVSELLNPARQ